MTILPAAYLGSVEYFAHLLCDDCVIDLGEHFVKRSERNRAQILASGGVMDLTVHVQRANRPRTPMRDVRLDYSKRWQHQHWISLVSAYRGSPYFDHYRSSFEPFYRREYDFLVDYDLELTEVLLQKLNVQNRPRISGAIRRSRSRRPRSEAQTKRGPGVSCRVLFPGLFRPAAFRA